MFTAMMLLVFASAQNIEIADTRGPYSTEAECQDRLVEMQASAVEHFSAHGLMKIGVKCEQTPTI